jgi:Tfp pilus assembly protein PilP
MKPTRAAAYLGGGTLLAAWLASAAGVRAPTIPPVPDRTTEAQQLDALTSGVQSQAARLRQRLSTAPSPQPTVRNPFEFALQPRAVVNEAKALDVAPPVVETPHEPNLVLIGLAEDGPTRTAMIESGDDLVMASEGQTVAVRYRVAKVSADAIELVDLVTGTTRRLFLKSPASLL